MARNVWQWVIIILQRTMMPRGAALPPARKAMALTYSSARSLHEESSPLEYGKMRRINTDAKCRKRRSLFPRQVRDGFPAGIVTIVNPYCRNCGGWWTPAASDVKISRRNAESS
jgi:hypothetical protein